MIPELGYLSIDGAALQRGATQPQNHHPGIVLGQTVTPLVSHHTGAPPSHPAPLTITQPQSLQERSCGQTRKLFSSERTQRVGRLKLGGMGTVVRTTECRIRNLRPTNPLLGALRARLGGDFSVVGRQDGASVKAIMNINEFNDKAALEQFCNFVEVMRSCYNVDDQAIAFLLLKGCP